MKILDVDISGEQGSGKTTMLYLIRSVLDGNLDEAVKMAEQLKQMHTLINIFDGDNTSIRELIPEVKVSK